MKRQETASKGFEVTSRSSQKASAFWGNRECFKYNQTDLIRTSTYLFTSIFGASRGRAHQGEEKELEGENLENLCNSINFYMKY